MLAQTEVNIQVAGVCGMCKDRIEGTANELKGVESAEWNNEEQNLKVSIDPTITTIMDIHRKMASIGHGTDLIEANESAYNNLPGCCKYKDENNPHYADKVELKKMSFRVAGVCGMCKDRIESVAMNAEGVDKAEWDSESQYLSLNYDPSKLDEMGLHNAIAKAGHETDLYSASEVAYENLPACCQYKDENNPHYLEDGNGEKEGNVNDIDFSKIYGKVYELQENGYLTPLIGANLYWNGTETGTSSDLDGSFELEVSPENSLLVVSYVGYKTDTLTVEYNSGPEMDVILSSSVNLEVLEIVYRKKATEISLVDPIKVHKIGEEELMKAACCNLSESFETNPSIDVSFTDAVTGTRKIEMLGLAGKYVQITRESMPDIRAMSAINGLTYTPGPWIEGIQMNMGTGSVTNGFESITGQINVELRKPGKSDALYLNLYGNAEGRMEGNLNLSQDLSEKVSGALLLHGSTLQKKSDHNEDSFLDKPIGEQFIAVNRWKYVGDNGMMAQFGIKGTYVDKTGGQVLFDNDNSSTSYWGALQKTKRLEAWMKTGKIFPSRPYSSIGFQLSGVSHNQESTFGLRQYDAKQNSLYANLIYQSIFNTTTHQYRTGISLQADNIEEYVIDKTFLRNEWVPGAFFEYTYLPDDKFSLVGGVRGDWHSDFGFFFTPRLNIKYSLNDRSALRLAAGRGQRTANIFAENIGYFASSRTFNIEANGSDTPYGLEVEKAWNFGFNFTQLFDIGNIESVFSIDAYHTRFENQIVVDLEKSGEVSFYNLDGESYSNSIQAQMDITPLEGFDIRMAYRFNDVKSKHKSGLLQKALSAKNRAFINFGYATKSEWKYDLTLNWQGQKRIPDTSSNPENYRLDEYSPSFFMLNAQVSKSWNENFELYVGGENLLNYRQENPIIASDAPFSSYFDSSLIWGPVFGRNIYAGLRYRIK